MMEEKNIIKISSLRSASSILHECSSFMDKIDSILPLEIDMQNIDYAKTIAMSILARELKYIFEFRKEKKYETHLLLDNTSDIFGYLNFMGYFDFINYWEPIDIEMGKMREKIDFNPQKTYIPITIFNYSDIHTLPNEQYASSDIIDSFAGIMANLLIKDKTTNSSQDAIKYIFREILRNCYEHSNTNKYYVWGQYLHDNSAELVIYDEGIGFYNTLKKKYPELTNQQEAILKSLEPGVSEASFEDGQNKYDNSGFGLYVISELCKRHGIIFIASKDVGIYIRGNDICPCALSPSGTLIGIRLYQINNINFKNEIDDIIKTGEKISTQSRYPTYASKKSKKF